MFFLCNFLHSADDPSNCAREFTLEEPILTPVKDPRPIHDENQQHFR